MSDFASAVIEWGSTPDTITLLELLKQQLGIDDVDSDDELSMYLEMAGVAAEKYLDNIIVQRSVTERLKQSASQVALRYYPVVSIESVKIKGVEQEGYYAVFEEGIGWALRDACGNHVSCCFEQMTIDYIAGYDPLPADLGFALVQGAKEYTTGFDGGPIKKESIVGIGSIDYDTSGGSGGAVRSGQLPASAVAVLDTYRRIFA